jgi:Flp pilus assembly protein TadD
MIDGPPPRWRGDALDRALQIGGAAAIESNDMATAAHLLTLAAERSPNDAVVLNNLAFALAEAPSTAERALEVATRATTIAPDNPNFWDTRGTCADRAGRSADAHASYREALRLYATRPAYDPAGRAGTALRLADSLKLAGQPQAARQVAAEVSKFSPAPPAADLDRAARLAAEE